MKIVINSHWQPPIPNAPMLGWVMGRGKPGGSKEWELWRQSVPSLRGGGCCNKPGFWCPVQPREEWTASKKRPIYTKLQIYAQWVPPRIYTYFLFRAKCWLRGGVGGQFPKNLNWSHYFKHCKQHKWALKNSLVDKFSRTTSFQSSSCFSIFASRCFCVIF